MHNSSHKVRLEALSHPTMPLPVPSVISFCLFLTLSLPLFHSPPPVSLFSPLSLVYAYSLEQPPTRHRPLGTLLIFSLPSVRVHYFYFVFSTARLVHHVVKACSPPCEDTIHALLKYLIIGLCASCTPYASFLLGPWYHHLQAPSGISCRLLSSPLPLS